jgi:PAS domain S-box-containing protein
MQAAEGLTSPSQHLPRGRELATLLLFCVAYLTAYKAAFLLPATAGVIAAIWPASGIALAAVLLTPCRLWPVTFVALFAVGLTVNLAAGKMLTHSLFFGLANCGEGFFGALVITRLCAGSVSFSRALEVLALFLAATLVNASTALIGAATASLSSAAPVTAIFATWWISNALGLLLITPLIVSWTTAPLAAVEATPGRYFEAAVLLVLWSVLVWQLFALPGSAPISPYAYVIFALLAWVAFRLGTRGTTAFLAILAVIAIGHTVGSEPAALAGYSPAERLLLVQLFVGMASVTGLLMAASAAERRLSEAALRVLGDNLPDGMVYQATLDADGSRRFLYVSAGVERLHGLSAAAVLRDAQTFYDQLHAADRPLVAAAELKSKAEMSVFCMTIRIRRADGALRWMQVSSMPRCVAGGRCIWDGVEIDVTDRMEAQLRLQAALDRSRSFLRYSPIVYWRCDAAGRIEAASRRCQELLAWRAINADVADPDWALSGACIKTAFPEECVRWFNRYVEEARRSGRAVTNELETATGDGRRCFLATLFPIEEPAMNDVFAVVAVDITDLKLVERERERLNAILTRVTAALPVCLSYIDGNQRYAWTNARNGERLGHAPEWIIGRTLREVWGERYAAIEQDVAQAAAGLVPHREIEWIHPTEGRRVYDGYMVPVASGATAGAGRDMVTLLLDITEVKQAAERERATTACLRVLSQRLLEAQESERRAVARELHDEVGQLLTAVNAMLQTLRKKTADAAFGRQLDNGIALVNRSIDDIRDVSLRLRPAILDDLGLVPALRWLVAQQRLASGLAIALEIEALTTDVPPPIATGCFRIVQEAITNAIRHARASAVTVRLGESEAWLDLEIGDDGVGFSDEQARAAAAAGRSSGLSGMRERAELLGGHCEVSSAPGAGTRVHARLPLGVDSGDAAAAAMAGAGRLAAR